MFSIISILLLTYRHIFWLVETMQSHFSKVIEYEINI